MKWKLLKYFKAVDTITVSWHNKIVITIKKERDNYENNGKHPQFLHRFEKDL